MSYGATGVLGTLTAAIPRRWRPAWLGWWLAVAVVVAAVGHDFTDVGHAVALVLGMLVSTRFGAPAQWTRARFVLLGVAASFGFLVLASTSLVVATAAGLTGATLAECWAKARTRRKSVHQADTRAIALVGNAFEAQTAHRL
jgi:hypothetical protein